MHIALAALFALHGIAHWIGFVIDWRLTAFEDMPAATTLLAGRIDVGEVGMRAVGVLWLLTGLAFLVVAAATAWQRAWWTSAALGVTAFSLAMSVLSWPDARLGVYLNVGILAVLAIGIRYGWFPPAG